MAPTQGAPTRLERRNEERMADTDTRRQVERVERAAAQRRGKGENEARDRLARTGEAGERKHERAQKLVRSEKAGSLAGDTARLIYIVGSLEK